MAAPTSLLVTLHFPSSTASQRTTLLVALEHSFALTLPSSFPGSIHRLHGVCQGGQRRIRPG